MKTSWATSSASCASARTRLAMPTIRPYSAVKRASNASSSERTAVIRRAPRFMPTRHQAPPASQMWRSHRERSARERFAAARAARDLVLDDAEVSPRQRVDVALEGERPVLGRPLPHVVEAVGDLFCRHPVRFLQHDVGADVDPPWVVLVTPCAAPDRGVVLIHRGGDGHSRGEAHPPGHVIKEAVAYP